MSTTSTKISIKREIEEPEPMLYTDGDNAGVPHPPSCYPRTVQKHSKPWSGMSAFIAQLRIVEKQYAQPTPPRPYRCVRISGATGEPLVDDTRGYTYNGIWWPVDYIAHYLLECNVVPSSMFYDLVTTPTIAKN